MPTELVQRRGLLRRTYSLTEHGIRVSERSPTSGRTLTVPYAVMYGDRQEQMSASKPALLMTVVLSVLAVLVSFGPDAEKFAWLFWGVFALIAGAYYWASRRDQVGYVDGKAAIFFFCNIPSTDAVEAFIDEARGRARERLRELVLPLRRSGDPDFDRQRALMMRDKGIISDDEYAEFMGVLSSPPPERLQN